MGERDYQCLLYRLVTDQSTLLLLSSTNGRVTLSSGCTTLQKRLGLRRVPERVSGRKPFLSTIANQFMHDYSGDHVLYRKGSAFSGDEIEKALHCTSRLLSSDIPIRDLIASGDIKISEAPNLASTRALIAQEDKDSAFDLREDLDGGIDLTFRQYDNMGQVVPDGRVTVVPICGYPGDVLRKQKHTWVYSVCANYGKTTTILRSLVDKYRATFVSDSRNAINVPRNAQFLCFDEVSFGNKIAINQLKGLTSGDATTSYLNRKSYGESYVPRKDAQFIFSGNCSPYRTYAVYDRVLGRFVITEDVLSTLEARFNIYRLDGDDRQQKAMFLEVPLLTESEYGWHLRDFFYRQNRQLNNRGLLTSVEMRESLLNVRTIQKARFAGSITNMALLAEEMEKVLPQIDWLQVDRIFSIFGERYGFRCASGEDEFRVTLRGDRGANTPYELIQMPEDGPAAVVHAIHPSPAASNPAHVYPMPRPSTHPCRPPVVDESPAKIYKCSPHSPLPINSITTAHVQSIRPTNHSSPPPTQHDKQNTSLIPIACDAYNADEFRPPINPFAPTSGQEWQSPHSSWDSNNLSPEQMSSPLQSSPLFD